MELSKIENYGIDMLGTFCCPIEADRGSGTCEDCPYFEGLILTEGRKVEILCEYYKMHERHEKAEG